jgi:phage/plasmid-like protein (TIGR03299 family)
MTTVATPADRRVPWIAKALAGDLHLDVSRGSRIGDLSQVLAPSAMEARKRAGLDYEATLEPVYAVHLSEIGVDYREIEGTYTVQRSTDQRSLGVVGERYVPLQTKDQAYFVDALIDTSDTKGVIMGQTKGGSQTFAALELTRRLLTELPDEAISTWFIVVNSFDGSTSFSGSVVPLRGACVNGLTWTVESAQRTWKIRHTKSAEIRIDAARAQLGLVNTYLDRFEVEARELLATRLTNIAGQEIVETLFPDPEGDSKRALTMTTERREVLLATWIHAPNLEDIRHTGWGFLNAVAEYDQWERTGVKTKDLDRSEWNMERITSGRSAGLVDRARVLVLARTS